MTPDAFTLQPNPHPSRANAVKAIWNAPNGFQVTIQEPKRSKPQNRKLHALLGRLVKSGYQWYGKNLTKDEWKIMFSAQMMGQKIIPALDGNGFVACGYHTSDMSEKMASDLIELIYVFVAEREIDLGPEVEDIQPTGRIAS